MNKQILKYFILISLAFVIVIAQSCDDSLTSTEIDNLVMPDSNVSYRMHVAPVFEVKCVPCHNSQQGEAGLDLSSWVNATRDPTIIFPGSDSTSILVYTIERFPPYAPMPPYEWLQRNHINGIRTWIREGAQNN
jgi:Planctomycete cytochrome C